MQRLLRATLSGFAGAAAVNLLNEGVQQLSPRAPHLDRLGAQSLRRLLRRGGVRPPKGKALFGTALAADLLANTLYYALVEPGARPRRWLRGVLLGTAAGAGAVVLPPRLGLDRAPTARTRQTKAMSVLWYLAGGMAAAGVSRVLARTDA